MVVGIADGATSHPLKLSIAPVNLPPAPYAVYPASICSAPPVASAVFVPTLIPSTACVSSSIVFFPLTPAFLRTASASVSSFAFVTATFAINTPPCLH